VLVVNVLSKDKNGFNGPDLLQILLACDLRFGKMQIFHRYENAHGRGPIQFSLANLVEPGTFDLDAIDTLTTPGVSFFMTLPGPQQSITAFNYMIETAQVLVRNLNAELRDDAQSVMTAQTIEHCRQRIRDFERRQLTLQL
jgi:cell division protein ZipA